MARRSLLFSPGDSPELLRKAPDSGADVLVFDLEDAVAPDDKPAAREAVRDVLADPALAPAAEICVRVNPAGVAADADLDAVLAGGTPDLVMLPKAGAAGDVDTLSELLREHDADVPVLPLVESAQGVLNAPEIAAARGVTGLAFGAEDLAADVGATRTREGTEVAYARQRVVLAAAAAGVDAIDSVYTDIEDHEGLAADARTAATLGYDGKMAIHPGQVSVVNDAFTPDPDEVAWARRVLDAAETADAGVFRVDGEMIDAPLLAQARQVDERARTAGVTPADETDDGDETD